MLRFCNKMLNGKKKVGDINETIILLIPKVTDPKNLT